MVKKAVKFWDMVQNKIPPAIVAEDDETLQAVYPTSNEEIIIMDEINDRVSYLQEIKMHIEEMTKERKEIETELKSIIKDNQGLKTPQYKVMWKTQTANRLDTDRLRGELPEIADKYTVVNSYRVLRVLKNKEVVNGN